MAHLTGTWQHVFSLLSTSGQGGSQTLFALAVALLISLSHHRSLKQFGADALFFPLAVFAIWFRFFGWKTLNTAWNHLQKAPQAARIWVMSVPVFLLVGLMAYPLKVIFGRPRPKMLAGHDLYAPQLFEWTAKLHAYPSGHTITTFALLAVLWPLYKKPWQRALMLVIASIVALARVGIGSHWLGDVLAGMVLGFAGAWILMLKYRKKMLKEML